MWGEALKIDRTFFNSKWRERLEELLILNNEKATSHIEELKLNLVSNCDLCATILALGKRYKMEGSQWRLPTCKCIHEWFTWASLILLQNTASKLPFQCLFLHRFQGLLNLPWPSALKIVEKRHIKMLHFKHILMHSRSHNSGLVQLITDWIKLNSTMGIQILEAWLLEIFEYWAF